MPQSLDQLGRSHEWSEMPKRVVSLVPSITELLSDLGLEDDVLGCTKFCVHPGDLRQKSTVIGGTKNVHLDKVIHLRPHLIIANKEENRQEDVEELSALFNTWVSDVSTISEEYQLILLLGELLGKEQKAKEIVAELKAVDIMQISHPIRVAYLIWKDPYMTVGGDTYISHRLEAMGLHNVYGFQQRYPSMDLKDLTAMDVDMVFLSSEPFPFNMEHLEDIKDQLERTDVRLVDGEFFSWYGSRRLHMKKYAQDLLGEITNEDSRR